MQLKVVKLNSSSFSFMYCLISIFTYHYWITGVPGSWLLALTMSLTLPNVLQWLATSLHSVNQARQGRDHLSTYKYMQYTPPLRITFVHNIHP